MKKVFLIFRKDCRHLWPEILLTLVVTAAFAWVFPIKLGLPHSRFENLDPRMARLLDSVAGILIVVLPLTWFLLLVRAVQSDPLIGNRQFWLTRPYGWRCLLSAKALFALTFVCLPFTLAEAAFLVQAGFSPLAYVPGLLFNLLPITALLLLPIFALATVTLNFARIAVTILVLATLAGLTTYFMEVLNLEPIRTVSNPYGDHIVIALILVCMGLAILIQYATRRVWTARFVIFAGTALSLIALLPSSTARFLFRHAYPASPIFIPVHIASPPNVAPFVSTWEYRGHGVGLNIPIDISGIPVGYAISLDNAYVRFSAPDGSSSISEWEQQREERYLPGTQQGWLETDVDPEFFARVQGKPVNLHVSIAVSQLAAGKPEQFAVQREMNLGRLGICSFASNFPGELDPSSLDCRTAMRQQPRLTLLTAQWSSEPCDRITPEGLSEHTAWDGNADSDPADLTLVAVSNNSAWFGSGAYHDWRDRKAGAPRPHLCPGTPLKATPYHVVQRGRIEFDLENVTIPAKTDAYRQ